MLEKLRLRLERYGASLTTREALALVECAEALSNIASGVSCLPGYSALDAQREALAALAKLESL